LLDSERSRRRAREAEEGKEEQWKPLSVKADSVNLGPHDARSNGWKNSGDVAMASFGESAHLCWV
jgi:hypothetical protein